jgi:hypothetical protein
MKIELKEITIRDIVDGYKDNAEAGVVGFSGKLDIRPPFQREFIYKDKQRDAVITTIIKNFPLNVMYWAVREDGNYEVIDGQQRTISFCQYVNGDFAYPYDFSFSLRYFHNLKKDEQDQILDYKLMIYVCSGTDSEKLEWFKTINIASEKLTDQELRNAVYAGPWVSDAKKHFSKPGCPAYQIGSDYLVGSAIRQDYLEKAIEWISNRNIEVYMANHQHDQNANALWLYYQTVITWVSSTFIKRRKNIMKGVDWGALYNKYNEQVFDTNAIEVELVKLLADDDVTNYKGIYPYVLTKDEKHLNIRGFSDNMKQRVYERQKGICVKCNKHFELSEMESDHITPWHDGGRTLEDNCQLLCKDDNRRKSGK